jgi:hypothetical protein
MAASGHKALRRSGLSEIDLAAQHCFAISSIAMKRREAMRPHVFGICVFLMAPMISPLASFAQQEIASDAGEVVLDTTVNAIDVENRVLTITGPDGNAIAIKATPEILGRVKLNEQITIRYADELATALRTINDAPPANKGNVLEREETAGMNMNAPTVAEQTWVEAAPQGETELNTVEVTATVANVEYGRRVVTFYGPNGTMRNVRIAPGVQGLDTIQQGDRVVMLLTRAVAIDIRPR